MTEAMIVCVHCGHATEPRWEDKKERNTSTKGLTIWRKATILVRMEQIPDPKAPRVEFSFSMDAELAKVIDPRMLSDLISREFGKMARSKELRARRVEIKK